MRSLRTQRTLKGWRRDAQSVALSGPDAYYLCSIKGMGEWQSCQKWNILNKTVLMQNTLCRCTPSLLLYAIYTCTEKVYHPHYIYTLGIDIVTHIPWPSYHGGCQDCMTLVRGQDPADLANVHLKACSTGILVTHAPPDFSVQLSHLQLTILHLFFLKRGYVSCSTQ